MQDSPYPVVVFDLDDTLHPEIDYVRSAYQSIAEYLEVKIGNNILLEMEGYFHHKKNVFKSIIDKYNLDISIDYLLSLYRNHTPTLHLKDEVNEVLCSLKANNCIIGLISDGRSITQRNKLKALQIQLFFDDILISEETGFEKPANNNYVFFEKKYPGATYYYVGDNPRKDFLAPNRLGWISLCLLNSGKNIHPQVFNLPEEFLPTYRIANLSELLKIVIAKEYTAL